MSLVVAGIMQTVWQTDLCTKRVMNKPESDGPVADDKYDII